MQEKARKKKEARLTLSVKVRLEQAKDKELPEVMLYAFDEAGSFLTTATLPKGQQSETELKLPAELLGATVRVLVGPPVAEEFDDVPSWMTRLLSRGRGQKEIPSLGVLIRRGAYEKRVRLHTESETLHLAIFPPDWVKWLLCPCVVRGRLVKRLTLPDGTAKDLGVCFACVKIYEVDKFPRLILRLPEHDLFRLRDELRVILEKWPPELPPKELPPEFRPKVWPPPPPPPPVEQYSVRGSLPPMGGSELETSGMDASEASPSEHQAEALTDEARNVSLAGEVRTSLEPIFMATSASQLRTALIAKADILVQLACVWEWLHFYFHTDLIKCVCTDEQGRFETTIWYPCSGDKPDLYFKAVQCIGGTLHTIYDPGVACHTYWNYQCGNDVLLVVTDPAARTCVPPDPVTVPPGVTLWVMPYAVGGIRLDQIKSSGLTDHGGGGLNAPFGGRLGLRHGYSSSIPIDSPNKPFFYRWLYKKDGEPEWNEFAEPVAETVVRHYVDTDLAKPDEPPTFPVYTLGPHSLNGMHLYEFKPHLPPQVPGHKTEWPIDDWFADIYSGILKSPSLPGGVEASAGKYKIKLEIYDKAGNRITPGSGTFRFIVPTGLDIDGVTILTRNATPAELEDDGFIFYLHVDNRNCSADIDAPTIDSISAGDVCGFLRYQSGDKVKIAYHATHPANFATFSFWIKRAAQTLYPVAGEVAAASAGVYAGDGSGNFEHDFSTGALLGPCTEAAFAEILRVYAKATNGWDRITAYDAHDERAFALALKK